MTVKMCRQCKVTKPVDEFAPRSDRPGWRYRCHECDRAYSRQRYKDVDYARHRARYVALCLAAGLPYPAEGHERSSLPNYRVMHQRIRRARGRAAEYRCAHCTEEAEQWAFDHADPYPVIGLSRYRGDHECLLLYSLDPMHYLPLCRPCHHRFDVGR